MLIESKQVNHTVEFHDDGVGIYARLTDESGDTDIFDETAEVRSDGAGNFMLQLRSGSWTPGSPEEVVYLLSKLPFVVRLFDDMGEEEVSVDRSRMPESDEDRLMFLTAADGDAMREAERVMADDRSPPPAWYVALKEVWAAPGRSLFP